MLVFKLALFLTDKLSFALNMWTTKSEGHKRIIGCNGVQ